MCSRGEHLPWRRETRICCTPTQCTKTFVNPEAYARELSVYKRGLDYVPKLYSSDDDRLTLVLEHAGAPLGTWMETVRHLLPPAIVDHLPDARRRYKDDVKALHTRFHVDTGLYHNDVQYKNVLRNEHGKLFLIDFEHASTQTNTKQCSGRPCWDRDGIFTS